MDNPRNGKTTIKSDENVAIKKRFSRYLRKYALPTGGAILILALSYFSWDMHQDTKEKTIRLNEMSGQVKQLTKETQHMQDQYAIVSQALEKQQIDLAEKDEKINAIKQENEVTKKSNEEIKKQNADLEARNASLVKKYKELAMP